jgi:hypothetical protein
MCICNCTGLGDLHSSKSEGSVVTWFMLLEDREQCNSSRYCASAVGRPG